MDYLFLHLLHNNIKTISYFVIIEIKTKEVKKEE